MDRNAEWITNRLMYDLPVFDVFHKEILNSEKTYDGKLTNLHVLFRNKFYIDATDKTIISISADDYYKLYINGIFVCSGPAPGYPWHYYYNEVDITQYIHSGENTIAVHTYYHGLINRVWVSGDNRHGMICSITSNGKSVLCSDESFKCRIHSGFGEQGISVRRHDTLFCEQIDLNAPETGFEQPDFDDSNWESCRKKTNADYKLVKQQTKTLEYYKVKPKKITKTEDGWLIDIGQEIVGYLNVHAKGKKGEVVYIRYAEEMCDNGSLMYDTRCGCHYEDKWILSGNNDSLTAFDYKGFRYAQIICGQGVTEKSEIFAQVRHYPFKTALTCTVDNSDIQKIWKLCENTLKYGTQECFIDCPTREKGQYLGDVCISAVAQAILTGSCDMLKKSLVDFAQSHIICPGLMAVAPCSFMQEIADYSLIYPMALLWYYKLSHDTVLLKELMPVLDGLSAYFKRYEREDGLIQNVYDKWNLVDWPENLRDGYDFMLSKPVSDGVHNVINAFYIGMLKCINEIKQILSGQTVNISEYESAYINTFFNSSAGLFTDSPHTEHTSLHGNILPLLFNIGINENVKNNIVTLAENKGITKCGTYFSFFVLQALKNSGEKELVLKLMRDKGAWLNMLSEGATTTFEAWGKAQKKNCSLFHPWSCCPILILYDM